MLSLPLIATVAVIIFIAELPDKTALASLVLGTRYPPGWVFTGAAAAFAAHVVGAVAVGSLLSLLPHRLLETLVGIVFLAGAVVLLRGRHDEELAEDDARVGFGRVAGTAFLVILVAEFGDLTEIVTANLAAKYHDPLSVGIGATAGLWGVAGLAILGGQGLLRVAPMTLIARAAALIMALMAAISFVSAVQG